MKIGKKDVKLTMGVGPTGTPILGLALKKQTEKPLKTLKTKIKDKSRISSEAKKISITSRADELKASRKETFEFLHSLTAEGMPLDIASAIYAAMAKANPKLSSKTALKIIDKTRNQDWTLNLNAAVKAAKSYRPQTAKTEKLPAMEKGDFDPRRADEYIRP